MPNFVAAIEQAAVLAVVLAYRVRRRRSKGPHNKISYDDLTKHSHHVPPRRDEESPLIVNQNS